MADFFPQGFWSGMAAFWMVIFLLFGLDLILFKARFVMGLGRFVNKRIHVDQVVVSLLENLKKNSEREVLHESAFLNGWGRFIAGGTLVLAAFLVLRALPYFH